MAKAEFNYKGNITDISILEGESMEDVCKKFANKVEIDINKIEFLYGENKLNLEKKYYEIINEKDKEKQIILIQVNDLKPDILNDGSNLIKSIFPICPECKEKAIFEINDYKIICSCKNGHSINMIIKEFENTQKIDLSKIVNGENKINNFNSDNNEMFLCNNCKIQLCPSCCHKHDTSHELINYDSKNYICEKHKEKYDAYCINCKINICIKCQKVHKKHEIKYYGEIFQDKNELLSKLKDLRNIIDIFNQDMKELIIKINSVKENLEILYNIYYEMINKYEDKYRNYEIIMSLNSIDDNILINDLKEINENNNIINKIENILDIYEKINFYGINIIYNINNVEDGEIQIFGEQFVENNSD